MDDLVAKFQELKNKHITDLYSEEFMGNINLINMKSRRVKCSCNIF